jgi:four helix bundle protein
MSDFKNLAVWQKSFNLAKEIYKLTIGFPKFEYYGLRSQLTRAAVSISTNIAEGRGRLHTNEYINFLSYARGSATETLNLLMLSEELGYIDREKSKALQKECISIIKMINALVNTLRKKTDKL